MYSAPKPGISFIILAVAFGVFPDVVIRIGEAARRKSGRHESWLMYPEDEDWRALTPQNIRASALVCAAAGTALLIWMICSL
jgi:hypothetical protein